MLLEDKHAVIYGGAHARRRRANIATKASPNSEAASAALFTAHRATRASAASVASGLLGCAPATTAVAVIQASGQGQSLPVAIGARTRLPHSVQDPS